ncbi:outer membrane protein [Woodsholea maritima]|uniref:outer membrane protein n=1 Tax=Woodsholea maritima TaxID=240237 RepID=UPI00038075BE|nr:outer membrane beta-barrel protein [Woodsholea maritima]
MIRQFLLATCAFFGASTLASAQDLTAFDGPYAGASLGAASYDLEGLDDNASGFTFGGFIGYRALVSDNWVLGGEAFAHTETADERFTLRTAEITVEAEHSYGLDAHLGRAYGQNLYFASLGYGWTKYKTEYPDQLTGSYNDTEGGWRIGLGYERAFTTPWSLRVRGIYQDYDRDDRALRGHLDLAYRF